MKANTRSFLTLLFSAMLIIASSLAVADEEQSYSAKVGDKALHGFANLTTSVLELPKNIINTSNQSNVAYGFIGGTAKGILNTVGRMMVGLTDVVTAPLPTKPYIYPYYVWDDFDADTTYGEVFRLPEE